MTLLTVKSEMIANIIPTTNDFCSSSYRNITSVKKHNGKFAVAPNTVNADNRVVCTKVITMKAGIIFRYVIL